MLALRFRRRARRLQSFELSAVPGDGLRPRCLLRRQSLFQRQRGTAVQSQPPIPKEGLMRILALAILAIGTVSIGPAAAQTYLIRFACTCTAGPTITNAATRRCLSATCWHRAARHSASSIHISRARKSPRVIGGIGASTKAFAPTKNRRCRLLGYGPL